MSQLKLTGNATGSGNVTLLAPPSTVDRTISLPDTTDTLAAVTSLGLRNRIINGKMEIQQRGASASIGPNAAAYLLDRWQTSIVGAAVANVSASTDVPASAPEFQVSHRLTVTTADASIAAGDYGFIDQSIEGFNIRDLIGRTFTLGFWVRSSKTGVHCVALRNSTPDRSYVAEYTINAANTWEVKTITVSGGLPVAGTWNYTNGRGLQVVFAGAVGSTFQTTANAWNTGNFLATANQVNCLDTVGNIFAITGVQLEPGAVATPFEHRPLGFELALCQRYYEPNPVYLVGRTNGTLHRFYWTYKVLKRSAPTLILLNGTVAFEESQVANRGVSGAAFNQAVGDTAGAFVEVSGTNLNGVPTNGAFLQINAGNAFAASAEL